jgi:CheY-like chemotaxis protein
MGYRVLVVDDEENVRDVLREMLETEGYHVQLVGTGRAALERMSQHPFDCVFVDLRMPEMDGLTLYQTIKQTNPRAAKRIVFCTGEWIEGYLSWFLKGTGNRVLPKPVLMDDVLDACRSVCRG